METAAITVGLGALGLQYILKYGGSGYFPRRAVQHHLERNTLYWLKSAPTLHRPAYLVYRSEPTDPETVSTAIRGLRQIASAET